MSNAKMPRFGPHILPNGSYEFCDEMPRYGPFIRPGGGPGGEEEWFGPVITPSGFGPFITPNGEGAGRFGPAITPNG